MATIWLWRTHTMSWRREARVGGVAIRSSAASRRALSLDVLSISKKRSISLGTGAIGMDRVARRTWDAVLHVHEEDKNWTIFRRIHHTLLTLGLPLWSVSFSVPSSAQTACARRQHGTAYCQPLGTPWLACCRSSPADQAWGPFH